MQLKCFSGERLHLVKVDACRNQEAIESLKGLRLEMGCEILNNDSGFGLLKIISKWEQANSDVAILDSKLGFIREDSEAILGDIERDASVFHLNGSEKTFDFANCLVSFRIDYRGLDCEICLPLVEDVGVFQIKKSEQRFSGKKKIRDLSKFVSGHSLVLVLALSLLVVFGQKFWFFSKEQKEPTASTLSVKIGRKIFVKANPRGDFFVPISNLFYEPSGAKKDGENDFEIISSTVAADKEGRYSTLSGGAKLIGALPDGCNFNELSGVLSGRINGVGFHTIEFQRTVNNEVYKDTIFIGPTGNGYIGTGTQWPPAEAFSAITQNGEIVSWGWDYENHAERHGRWGRIVDPPVGDDFAEIFGGEYSFAALRRDGSIAAWGFEGRGGINPPKGKGFVRIAATQYAFAALNRNGEIFCWGLPGNGGSDAPVGKKFVEIYSNRFCFVGMTSEGELVP